MRSGPALGGVILNQNWRLQSAPLNGETTFREVSAGVTGGYSIHVGKHFYIYPTAAYTYNNVYSGETSVNGQPIRPTSFRPTHPCTWAGHGSVSEFRAVSLADSMTAGSIA
jgi:hypothetical protein